jgi:dihydropyrimidinase
VPVVVQRLVAEMEPHELLGGEARDGLTADPAGAEPVGRVVVNAALTSDLAPEAGRIERDGMEIHAATSWGAHHEADGSEVERGRVSKPVERLDRAFEVVRSDREIEVPMASSRLADDGIDGPAARDPGVDIGQGGNDGEGVGRRHLGVVWHSMSLRRYSRAVTTPIASRGPDLLILGGTVVTADGSRRADVAIRSGRIEALEPDLSGLAGGAAEVVDASGLLVLPGCIDVHTHTRVASDTEPDRFYQDSLAAAFGGTTTFLAFNNPGTGSSPAAHRSILAGIEEFRRATASDSAVDFALSPTILGGMDNPLAELPAMVDAGIPTAKAFMVFDFRLADGSIFEAMRILGERGGMLEVHCEDPVLIDAAVEAALQRGDTSPCHHAATRSTEAEAVATHRAMAFARAANAPVHVVHLSCAAALRYVAEARATGVQATAETCPHYLSLTDARYEEPDPLECAKSVISPPLRRAADVEALWAGLAAGDLSLVATDHVPDRVAVEKGDAARGMPFNRISNGAPGIETMLAIVYGQGVARGRISLERMVDLLATTPARRFGLERKGAVEVGRDADLVLFDPRAQRTIRASDLHHTSDYTPYEGLEVEGAVRSVFVRGEAVIRDGAAVGDRGFGQFVERGAVAD